MFNLTQTCCFCTKYNINTKKKVFIVAVSGPFYNVTGLQFPLFKPKLYITGQIANKCEAGHGPNITLPISILFYLYFNGEQ